MCEHNECPTCTQDWVANTDYECGCCGRLASEHIKVTSLCRILRETQQREHALLVEIEDAKTTADLWMKHAKHADDAAADLKAELEDTRRHWKEELAAVQARLLDPHAVFINMLHGEIAKLDWEKLEHIHGNHPAREQYRLSSVCRELKEENEKLKRLVTWPHDVDPFTSQDHDNDQNIYQ